MRMISSPVNPGWSKDNPRPVDIGGQPQTSKQLVDLRTTSDPVNSWSEDPRPVNIEGQPQTSKGWLV